MKAIKVTLATAASALLLAAPAMAFHDGGVAKCEGCHSMHNSLNNVAMQSTGTVGGTIDQSGPYLLQGGGQPSDSCLNCHEGATISGYKISTSMTTTDGTTLPAQRTPGGDFSWLKLTTGVKGGHNILGTNHGYSQATKFVGNVGPGGNYPVTNLQCSSCHDPHGKYRRIDDTNNVSSQVLPSIGQSVPAIQASGSYNTSPNPTAKGAVGVYRILGGVGYVPKSITNKGLAFTYGAPAAVAPSNYNQSESQNMVRVAYGAGMSEWCANCHATIYDNGGASTSNTNGNHTHPAGLKGGALTGGSNDLASGGDIAGNYNAYKASGDLTGSISTAFDSLVPFEEGGTVSYATLKSHASNSNTNLAGPGATAQASCLSCHRVHASGFASMLRYQIDSTFVNNTDSTGTVQGWDVNNSGTANSNAWKLAAYNDKPATAYGAYQRPLCNKCHAKD